MDLGLAGKVALVSGASRGIGKAIAYALAAEGSDVAICARGAEALERAATEIDAAGSGRVLALPLDLTEPGAARRMVERSAHELGGVDVVVNNVGGGRRRSHASSPTSPRRRRASLRGACVAVDGRQGRSLIQGVILARIEPERTPMTVAGFVGLAEGTIANAAFDPGRPFFDGTVFHRVVPGHVIQAGIPRSGRADGPGYLPERDPRAAESRARRRARHREQRTTHQRQPVLHHARRPLVPRRGLLVFGDAAEGMDVARRTELRYDARGKITRTENRYGLADTLTVRYSGLGHLVHSLLVVPGGTDRSEEARRLLRGGDDGLRRSAGAAPRRSRAFRARTALEEAV